MLIRKIIALFATSCFALLGYRYMAQTLTSPQTSVGEMSNEKIMKQPIQEKKWVDDDGVFANVMKKEKKQFHHTNYSHFFKVFGAIICVFIVFFAFIYFRGHVFLMECVMAFCGTLFKAIAYPFYYFTFFEVIAPVLILGFSIYIIHTYIHVPLCEKLAKEEQKRAERHFCIASIFSAIALLAGYFTILYFKRSNQLEKPIVVVTEQNTEQIGAFGAWDD